MVDYRELKYELLRYKNVYKGEDKGTICYFEPSFYDSETSKVTEIVTDKKGRKTEQLVETWVYIWACSVGNTIYYGRTAKDFIDFLQALVKLYELNQHRRMTIYVHNLPYDISYLWDLLKILDPQPKLLTVTPQRPFYIELKCGIDFKCSFKLVNKSLEKWGKDLQIKQQKKIGIKDYNVVYKPTDTLPDNEYIYLEYDILSLKECYYKELELQGYNFWNCPLTSTGFIRKIFQKAYKQKYNRNRRLFESTRPTANQYKRLVACAMGGMTQGNILKSGVTVKLHNGLGHRDFDSHYPTQQLNNPFPMKPITIYDVYTGEGKQPNKNTLSWYIRHGYYFVMECELKNVKVKKGVTAPFMCNSKVKASKGTHIYHFNGKIVSISDGGIINTTITNFDYIIFSEQYDFSIKILSLDIYTTAKLPDYVTDTIKEQYKLKTELKEVVKAEPTEENELNLLLSKQRLNGIFGCTYTRLAREEISLNYDSYVWSTKQPNIEDSLDKYYNSPKNCLAFQWGVFTTSLARYELYNCIKLIGYENFLYCDTDSIFYRITEETERNCEEYNKKCLQESIEKGLYVDYGENKRKYLHKFDTETDHGKSKTFRFLHAKCYALEPDNQLKITVAGVTRHGRDGRTREEELGNIDNLQQDFVFDSCGGTRSVYNCHNYYYNKEVGVWTGGGCAILDNTKTLHEIKANECFNFEWFAE